MLSTAAVSTYIPSQRTPDQATHPGYFRIIRQGPPEAFSSKLVAERDYPKGSVIAPLEGLTFGEKRYSSVQVSENEHVELNSDLVFMNHSCDPTTHMDVEKRAVTALKDIKAGDEMFFFYPSTEWDMAQPFQCWCSTSKCIKTVRGAKYLSSKELEQFTISAHIAKLAKERDEKA
ncbi:hypothetical protein J3Q64DRAFT_1014645 [Phycomyces blakesleeanus]|uniref:SET domain-containing protein n=2 Tax=Phycomyces blakesleeanus TaxID=4837 RepID=A0A167PBK7_PHYB8|nr:hypothetical protein PHYBLDRAFT_108062 [Phycomyces blakesleeanus NRRL 1555(-)]OAD77607.1 hypothetical protein PHYBLDRAFT_108062 [Phycomyces blakesleeanus NRRL 1555(-)]|eukprot:XP_018295647.1 hypothetical protein PHYBLDRAFT_108062 [Phycomyces blakesleeanus NRRL 1555(-)]